ncbi:MAG: single-stranded DNA-binding protein [Prevotella sp.]|nr:single-stranded DNA-binding protein [Prevotella sp.]
MNKVMLIGNVGQEPDVHYYGADQARAEVRLATTERGYKLPNGTEVPARTEWHTLLFFGNMAKTVEHYVHKGDKLYVEGKIRYSVYNDKMGQRRYVTEILVNAMEMLSAKPAPQPSANPSAQSSNAAANPTEPNKNGLPF